MSHIQFRVGIENLKQKKMVAEVIKKNILNMHKNFIQ